MPVELILHFEVLVLLTHANFRPTAAAANVTQMTMLDMKEYNGN